MFAFLRRSLASLSRASALYSTSLLGLLPTTPTPHLYPSCAPPLSKTKHLRPLHHLPPSHPRFTPSNPPLIHPPRPLQHCRCCGCIFCDACSSGRCTLPGFGYLTAVRVCDDCRKFETEQLPMLLAGEMWIKRGDRIGIGQKRFLRLSADQTLLVWSTWR